MAEIQIQTTELPAFQAPDRAAHTRRRRWKAAAAISLALILFLLWMAFGRHRSSPIENITQTVAIAKVSRQDLSRDLVLTAEFRPYQQVMVHAKVAGYVQSIGVDIGDHVKAGQAVAELEIPEARQDLKRASAAFAGSQDDVKRAEANYEETHVAYERLVQVAKQHPQLVAQQDLDTEKSKDDAMESALDSAKQRVDESAAEQEKMRAILAYGSITAPFDGVVTKRFADTGALVQAGISSETQAMPLVELAEDDRLRLVFPVPESAVPLVHVGLPVEITVDALHKTFAGAVSRYAGKVDRSTRTMETEVDVPNAGGIYTPGTYVSVRLLLDQRKGALAVPLQSLAFQDGVTVLVLNSQGVLEERKVEIGLQTPSEAEIVTGLKEGESVVVGNRTGLRPGQKAVGKVVEFSSTQ